MKLLWLCNLVPGAVREQIRGGKGSGLWVDRVLAGLQARQDIQVRILCPSKEVCEGTLAGGNSYATFRQKLPYEYLPELEARFEQELEKFQPDVIHIWGTEYSHTLSMVKALQKKDLLSRAVVHIQGLCYIYADHYAEGVPHSVQRCFTLRDVLRQDAIFQQQKKFVLRGELEIQALQLLPHVMGRTDWDLACTRQINPNGQYHFCNETLREAFYQGQWRYENCQKHRLFASSCVYPVKGFHYLLQAFGQIAKRYPDATLAVPGRSFLAKTAKEKLRQSSYQRYLEKLARQYRLEEKIEFLGSLSAEQMKEQFLLCNAFVLPSTIENSPNSLGEAMLLGAPCIASDVGGVSNMLRHNREGYVYQSTAPYMLEHYIDQVFSMGEEAEALGSAARDHARITHDPQKNLEDLLAIYQKIAKE